VVAANIGSPDRLSYLLVGDTVNIASRLQSLTRKLDAHIIISSQTYDRLKKEQLKNIKVKKSLNIDITGKKGKVDIYSIG
jgi:class 3 adenylate cyclase